MKNLILLLLTCLPVMAQLRPVGYDAVSRNITPTNMVIVAASGNYGTLQVGNVNVVSVARSITIAGTANEITSSAGAQDLSANRTWTLSLPTALTFSGKTVTGGTFSSPSIGTPTITGAITFPDNTRQTFNPGADAAGINVGSHAGDPGTPSNGDLWYSTAANALRAHINGSTVSLGAGGGGSAPVGTMVNSGTPEQYAIPVYADDTGTNMIPSSLKSDATGTNFYAGGFLINTLTVTNPIPVTSGGLGIASGTSGGIPYFSASTTIASSGALAANALVIGGGAGAAPSTTTTGSGVLTALGNTANASGGITTPNGTAVLTEKTYDASASGNVLKQTRNLILQRPDYGDGIGAVPQTNTYTTSGLMHFTFSGNAETNANWTVYEFDCPADLDTTVAMTARFAFLSGGTDTDDYVFHITYAQQAPGTAYVTGTSIATSPIVMTVTPTTPASGDLQQSAATTLTGWAGSLTPGRPMQVRVARLQNTQDDSARDVQLVISYGSTL